MARYNNTPLGTNYASKAALDQNFDDIKTAIDDSLSRKGDSPNQMEADLDMNSNQILNLPDAISPGEPVTLRQFNAQSVGTKTTQTLKQKHTATAGQTVFVTPQYVIGSNNLSVYINGVRQDSAAYSETTTTSVTLSEGVEAGDIVEVLVNELQESVDQVGAASVTYDGTTVDEYLDKYKHHDTVALAKANTALNVGDRVKTWGYTTAGDGGGAEYLVVAGGTGTDDGGSYHDMTNGNQLKLIHNGVANVNQFGAYGDNSNDDTSACNAALSSQIGKIVFLKGSTYKLTDQLNPLSGKIISAYGSVLNWTDFGSTLAVSVSDHAETGNGIRLLSNTRLEGGTYQATSVPTPSNRSIPTGNFSGAFWNIIAFGHFNTITTSSPEVATNNIEIIDVTTKTISGDRSSGIFGSGLTHDILIQNWTDDSSAATSATSFNGCEITWGSGATNVTYAPYNITFNKVKTKGVNLSSYEGIRLSGIYDVSVSEYRSLNTQEALTLYIGDPGTNATYGNPSQDSTRIGTGIHVRDLVCEKFNIGIQILGEGAGSTHTDPKTNLMDIQIKDINLIGNGKTTNTSPWTSNVGIFANTARGWSVENGVIRECYVAGISCSTSTGGAFTTPDEISIKDLHIYNVGRSGIKIDGMDESKIDTCRIHNTNESGVTPNASIELDNVNENTIIDCKLGKSGDSTRVSIDVGGTSTNNHIIRTDTFEEAAGIYVTSAEGQLIVHGNCTDTGSSSTSADRFSRIDELLNFGKVRPSAQISTGTLTATGTNQLVDTESLAASDDLDDIDFPNAKLGDVLTLTPVSSSRTINVRHAAGTGGTQTRTKSGATEALQSGPTMFQYDGNAWWKLF